MGVFLKESVQIFVYFLVIFVLSLDPIFKKGMGSNIYVPIQAITGFPTAYVMVCFCVQ